MLRPGVEISVGPSTVFDIVLTEPLTVPNRWCGKACSIKETSWPGRTKPTARVGASSSASSVPPCGTITATVAPSVTGWPTVTDSAAILPAIQLAPARLGIDDALLEAGFGQATLGAGGFL